MTAHANALRAIKSRVRNQRNSASMTTTNRTIVWNAESGGRGANPNRSDQYAVHTAPATQKIKSSPMTAITRMSFVSRKGVVSRRFKKSQDGRFSQRAAERQQSVARGERAQRA